MKLSSVKMMLLVNGVAKGLTTLRSLAEYAGVSPATVQRKIKNGELKLVGGEVVEVRGGDSGEITNYEDWVCLFSDKVFSFYGEGRKDYFSMAEESDFNFTFASRYLDNSGLNRSYLNEYSRGKDISLEDAARVLAVGVVLKKRGVKDAFGVMRKVPDRITGSYIRLVRKIDTVD